MSYKAYLGPIEQMQSFKGLTADLARGVSPVALFGLPEEHRAALTASLAGTGQILYVAHNDAQANRIFEDIRSIALGEAVYLPPREIGVFGSAAHSRDNTFARMTALSKIVQGEARIVVCAVEALLAPMMPMAVLKDSILSIRPGDVLAQQQLVDTLVHLGYESVEMVEGRGQFARRGGIVDLFPAGALQALRIEYFDDEIDTLRSFDVMTQRSDEELKQAVVAPASEVLCRDMAEASRMLKADLDKAKATAAPKKERSMLSLDDILEEEEDMQELPSLWEMKTVVKHENRFSSVLGNWEAMQENQRFEEIDHYLTYLHPDAHCLLDYMDALVILDEPGRMRERCENVVAEFHETLKTAVEAEKAIFPQQQLMRDWPYVSARLAGQRVLTVNHLMVQTADLSPRAIHNMEGISAPASHGKMEALGEELMHLKDNHYAVYLLAGGDARAQRLCDSLSRAGVEATLSNGDAPALPRQIVVRADALSRGFVWPECKLAVLSEMELFGVSKQRGGSRRKSGQKLQAFTDLKPGDYVVHDNHGVGIYVGTEKLSVDGKQRDYLHLKYNGTDKLYIPTDQMDRIQKYIGNHDAPPRLNKLGGAEWERQKNKVRQSVRELAFDLVQLYAQREQKGGFAYSSDTPWQREFEENFPYEETPDQLRSIQEIKHDMEKRNCMDRLLCGDVGYGKTEVALRAAFKAVMDGKQVAVLVPTTILAQQHYQTILKRFEGYPVTVQVLSRFKTAAEQTQIRGELAAGKIDIIVGTHKLLGRDVRYKNLGLLVVDEEQRFGVSHKEQIKNIKKDIDVLTLSATPIPRTLHMSMVGIRDISTIETPPEERYPVQTYVIPYSESTVRDAILREIARGGQVYFVYNRVASIDKFAEHIRQLVPQARVVIAHGQMRETQLEDVMMDFMEKKYDVLLCSTIIESGLDIPDVNTMIVFDADRFGLSQLYQLRGRVGRSNRLAYCYLTVRENKIITETAQKRLAAIKEFTEFGSGFKVAMRDLEIRGAGNLMGAQQSGHMASVGYDLYVKLIGEAVNEMKGKKRASDVETSVTLPVDAYLPDDYVRGDTVRMDVYKLIAHVKSDADRDDCIEELIDRFGDIPKPCENLVYVAYLKNACALLGIEQVFLRRGKVLMRFLPGISVDPVRLLAALAPYEGKLQLLAGETTSIQYNATSEIDQQIRSLPPLVRQLAYEVHGQSEDGDDTQFDYGA